MKIYLYLILLLCGCTTIHPSIFVDEFKACERLCHRNKHLERIVSNIQINYIGKAEVVTLGCVCKNNKIFEIAATLPE